MMELSPELLAGRVLTEQTSRAISCDRLHNETTQPKVLTIRLLIHTIPCSHLLPGSRLPYNQWRQKQSDLYPTIVVGNDGASFC